MIGCMGNSNAPFRILDMGNTVQPLLTSSFPSKSIEHYAAFQAVA